MNITYNKICCATILSLAILGLSGCKEKYTPLENQVFIAQTDLQSNAVTKVIVGLEDVTSSLNIRTSNPASEDMVFECVPDESVLANYNEINGSTLTSLPTSQFEIVDKEVVIKKGTVVSTPLNISIKTPSQEMKDSGKKYAIGLKIKSKSGNYNMVEGSDNIVVLISQQAIQDVVQFSSRSNIQINFAEEYGLKEWTLEFFVNMNKLGKDFGEMNNQTIFGVWGTGAEVDGVKHSGEIYTRFGDAPIEGNRFQIKTKGTQMNSSMLFEENKWYHIALVCSNTKLMLYVNGELDNSMDLPDGIVWMAKSGQLGNTDYLRAQPLFAQMRIWSIARTQTQIKDNMATLDPKTEGLIGYWRFNEGEGNTFKDATGKNPDAFTTNGSVNWVSKVKLN